MDQIPWFLVCVGIGFAAFNVGRLTVSAPAEDEMIRRIIALRAERMIAAAAKVQTEQELVAGANQQAAERLAKLNADKPF